MTTLDKRRFYVRASHDPTWEVALGVSSSTRRGNRLLDLAFAEACRTLPNHHVSCAELMLNTARSLRQPSRCCF